MDSSFELLSSMSPKLTKSKTKNEKKAPTKLSLKKHFRKSLSLNHLPKTSNSKNLFNDSSSEDDDSVILMQNNCTIVVLESDDDDTDEVNEKIKSNIKIETKKDCLSNDEDKQKKTNFCDISAIYGDNPKKGVKNNYAINSTFVDNCARKRFDELFPFENKIESQTVAKSNNINCKDENSIVIIEDSFEENKENKSNDLPNKDADLNTSLEQILDELYGEEWRKNKNELFKTIKNNAHKEINPTLDKTAPKTEPRKKTGSIITKRTNPSTQLKKRVSITYKNPYLDSERKKSQDLLNNLHKKRIKAKTNSPWTRILQSNNSDSSEDENLPKSDLPVRKLFSDSTKKQGATKKDLNSSLESVLDELYGDEWKQNLPDKKIDSLLLENTPIKSTSSNKQSNTNKKCLNTESKKNSFLASLSATVPLSQCDNSARVFKETYKTNKDTLARKLFNLYNETIFEKQIPTGTIIEWSERMTNTAGYCYCKKIIRKSGVVERTVRIVLSSKALDSADRLRDTLVHEMCHAATWIINEIADGHGYYWKSWASKAMKTYPELPPIKTRHDYVINTKYTYKCTDCGYSIGRHSKSLDVERKRCGLCYGKFEVFLNKSTKSGRVQTPAKKEINGFAKFVKDNYANVKTPELKHKSVMNVLSKQFALMNTK